MILLDTDVAIDILRNHAPALSWLQGLGNAPLGLPGLVMMELLQGCHTRPNPASKQTRIGYGSGTAPELMTSHRVRVIAVFVHRSEVNKAERYV